MTSEPSQLEFGLYMAPGTAPLTEPELAEIRQQAAELFACPEQALAPRLFKIDDAVEIEQEFDALIPETEQARKPYLALLTLLRNGARPVGTLGSALIYDLRSPFPVLDYLKGLAEITRMPVLLGVFRRPDPTSGPRQILLRRLR